MIPLIPIPKKYEEKTGSFKLGKKCKVYSEFELELLKAERSEDANLRIVKNEGLAQEEYTLDINEEGVFISAATETGAYYALQSLRQLAKTDTGVFCAPYVSIKDSPKYSWRGLSLDESRHFFGMEEVKRLLDFMFMFKLNVFHWHLTDDQGWRIEIKKYPLLTEIGSKRKETQINGWGKSDVIKEDYAGFYTQEQIKEVVDYASKRGIMVVPEIDMPAHFAAAMAAYPWLACRELEREVPGYFGGMVPLKRGIKDWNRTACLGKETTFEFIYNVIDEITELFPAPYFHIGGDEAPTDEWKKCPKCQSLMKEHGMADEYDLQAYFNNEILKYVEKKGKRLIGWNEILKSKTISRDVIGQYWTPKRDKNVEIHAKCGGDLILSNHRSFYFDMTYAQYPLDFTYKFDPERYHITGESLNRVLGVEAEIWTEWIDGREKLDLNLFPRVTALSEVAWSPQERMNWKSYKTRLDILKPTLKELGIGYARDGVSLPKNLFERARIRKQFHAGDTHLELKLNKKYSD